LDVGSLPSFHRLAEGAAGRPAEKTAQHLVVKHIVRQVDVVYAGSGCPRRPNPLQIGRLVGPGLTGLNGNEFLIQFLQRRVISAFVQSRKPFLYRRQIIWVTAVVVPLGLKLVPDEFKEVLHTASLLTFPPA